MRARQARVPRLQGLYGPVSVVVSAVSNSNTVVPEERGEVSARPVAPAPAEAHDVPERRVRRLRVQLHGGGLAPRERHRDARRRQGRAGQARVRRVAARAFREPARANAPELQAGHAASEGQREEIALLDIRRAWGRAERPPVRGAHVVHEPRPGAALGGGGAPVEQQLLRFVHDQSGPLDRRGVGRRHRVVPQRVERRLVARIVFPTTAPGEVLVGHDEHVPTPGHRRAGATSPEARPRRGARGLRSRRRVPARRARRAAWRPPGDTAATARTRGAPPATD